MYDYDNIKKEFLEPPDEFTPIPFWFWNDELTEDEIERQILDFYGKGVMGFVIHPRMGIPQDTPYMSPKFLGFVQYAVEKAASLGMKIVLYDEAMYPSGSAHGMVVKDNPEYATRCLEMTQISCPLSTVPKVWEYEIPLTGDQQLISVLAVRKEGEGTVLADSAILLTPQHNKISFQAPDQEQWSILIFTEGYSQGTIRGIHTGEDDGQTGAPLSGDLMNPAAMRKFIRLTYDGYYHILKEHFGTTIIAMFTDEPDVMGRCSRPNTKPWTRDFWEWYRSHGGQETDLPLLWFKDVFDDKRTSDARKTFKRAVNKRLEYSYYSQISSWCQEHHISLTGHPAQSDDIGFLKYFQIPGQDLVWRWVAPEDNKGIEGADSTMGKCSSDAARHAGRKRNANECFGCCGPNGIGWAFTADDMKWYLDWMLVRGVNLFYPHAFYYSIQGEIRWGERPPDVGPHNAWWKYYNKISDYIKRCCCLLTDSYNTTSIAILCEEDCLPWKTAGFFFQNQIEFNYLEESLLMSQECRIHDGCVIIQKQSYHVLIIEDAGIITPLLHKALKEFTSKGGKVIVHAGSMPGTSHVSNMEQGNCFPEDDFIIADSMEEIKSHLMNHMKLDVIFSPANSDIRVTHVVKESAHFYLVTNEGQGTITSSLHTALTGEVEIWNPWQGTCIPIQPASLSQEGMEIPIFLPRRESIIICIYPYSGNVSLRNKILPDSISFSNPVLSAWDGQGQKTDISSSWSIHTPWGFTCKDIKLKSWTQWDIMENFYGTAEYRREFEWNDTKEDSIFLLDLGTIHEIAHLHVNGRDAGVKLWGPYLFHITPYLQTGTNSLSLHVTNTPANRLTGSKLSSGLEGPVTLIQIPINKSNNC